MRKIALALFLGMFVIGFSIQGAMASDWKEEQRKLFEPLGIKPGDVIDKTNWEKVKDLLPPSVLDWVKKGEFVLKIAELEWDYSPDKEWSDASLANKGKYSLGENREIVDASTGKVPKFIYGYPYPPTEIDIKNDKHAAVKAMHNNYLGQYRIGSYYHLFKIDWVGDDGYERELTANWVKYFYWGRPDGEQPNPRGYQFLELIPILGPYDIAGSVNLTYRKMDGTPDDVFCYIPAIRRTKKLSGCNRSDPFFGTDFVNDDGNLWYGNNSSMKWTFLEEKTILHPLLPSIAKAPVQFSKQPNGSWRSPPDEEYPFYAYMKEGWKKTPGGLVAWYPTNVVWIPRTYWVIKGEPLDPYYNYGTMYFYMDKNSQTISFKVVNDKAGEYWKTCVVYWRATRWGDEELGGEKVSFGNVTGYVMVDDKTHHASICHAAGTVRGFVVEQGFMTPDVNPRMFTPSRLATITK